MWSVPKTTPPNIKKELSRLATGFRAAIQRSAGNVPDVLKTKFKAFPKDMCEFASNLLGRYLKEEGIENVQYVCGSRRTNGSPADLRHAWLEAYGFVIDITADQFPDGPGPAVVTEDLSWHSQFQVFERRDVADLHEYCKAARKLYDDVFREIIGSVSTSQSGPASD